MKVLLRFTCLMLMMVISLFSAFSVNAVDIHIIPVHGDHIYTADITETQD